MAAQARLCNCLMATVIIAVPVATATAQNQIDGIAASVNEEIVTIAEVRRAALLAREEGFGLSSLCEGRGTGLPAPADGALPPALDSPLVDAELTAARECLIDARLVFREVRRFPRVTVAEGEIDALFGQMRGAFASAEEFQDLLQRVALTEAEVRANLRRQLLVRDYVESRFRATVEITPDQAQRYWNDVLVPDLRARAVAVPAFESVRDDFVVPILQEQEVNRRVQSWISDLRERATIRRMYP